MERSHWNKRRCLRHCSIPAPAAKPPQTHQAPSKSSSFLDEAPDIWGQESANQDLQAKSSPPPVFVTKFYWNTATSFLCVLLMAVCMLWRQSWAVLTVTIVTWFAKPRIFAAGPFTGKKKITDSCYTVQKTFLAVPYPNFQPTKSLSVISACFKSVCLE